MNEALTEARLAMEKGEVPIGAVIVKEGEIVGRGHNLTRINNDPTCHAEIMAIKDAASHLDNWNLTGTSMYVTCEPCSMCAGALILARVNRLYIGARDPKTGACGSVFDIVDNPKLNHRIEVEVGIMEEECSKILKEFFNDLRTFDNK